MKTLKVLTSGTLFAVLVLALAPSSMKASDFDKKTIMTFSHSVQIPGKTLDAGTYVFQRANPIGDPNVIRVLSSDGRYVVATVMTVPTERMRPASKTQVTFAETRANAPEALNKWWYPGDITGQQFVYRHNSQVLAKARKLGRHHSRTEQARLETTLSR